MINKYFRIAFRSLFQHKLTTFIHLFGLAIGMTAAVFIFMWVQNEYSYDQYHSNAANIYRVTNSIAISKDDNWVWEASPMLLAESSVKQVPGVEAAVRLMPNTWGAPVLKIGNDLYKEKTSAWIDPAWFGFFDYEFVAGNVKDFAADPFSIVLTESKAVKYFGKQNPVGKTVMVDTVPFKVQAVVKDNPANSSFHFDVLLQLNGRLANKAVYDNDKTWNNFGYITFVRLHPSAAPATIGAGINRLIDQNRTNDNCTASLLPLHQLHFDDSLQSSEMKHGNAKVMYIFIVLGVLLLLVACINYVNLTTARASLRAKEVSMRKILGANKGSLFAQFMMESFTISLLAILVSLGMVKWLLPLFNSITGNHFEVTLYAWSIWKVLAGTLIVATLLNGIYPALLLSSFQPMQVFRGMSILRVNDAFVRKVLVWFQFSLSMLLIMAVLVIYRQLHFIQTKDPGYQLSHMFSVQVPYSDDEAARATMVTAMRQSIASNSAIEAVGMAAAEIVDVTASSSGSADWEGRDSMFNPTMARLRVDTGFQSMFRLRMAAGRWFNSSKSDEKNYILNETAVADLHLPTPAVGQWFSMGGDTGRVIGVVKDFHYRNLHEKIGPMVLSNNAGADSYFFIKTSPQHIAKAVSAVAAVWAEYIPNQPFNYSFLDERFALLYESDQRIARLILIFSVIAVVIAAMGLFGLAAFAAAQRTKEIGIRKVLGASVQQIALLLSRDFLWLVLLGIIAAAPLAWWAMNRWLQEFAYRISISAWIFIAAGAIAIMVALVTVSTQALKAAMAKPVDSLRTE